MSKIKGFGLRLIPARKRTIAQIGNKYTNLKNINGKMNDGW
jgi:hypothetical protein